MLKIRKKICTNNNTIIFLFFIGFNVSNLVRSAEIIKNAEDDLKFTFTELDDHLPTVLSNMVIDYVKYSEVANQKLFLAIYEEDISSVKQCIEEGANVNCTFARNITPIFLAIEIDSIEMVAYLIRHNAKINESSHGVSALHYAAQNDRTDIVKYLIACGARVNAKARNYIGNTALHYAVLNNNLELVRYLVGKNAYIFAKNKLGETPFELSKRFKKIYQFFCYALKRPYRPIRHHQTARPLDCCVIL